MKRKLLTIACLILAAMLVLTSCGGGSNAKSGEKPVVNLWVTGSDNIRLAYEKIEKTFNEHPEYSKVATLKVQFMGAGGGQQSMQDKILAAYKAGETETDFDLIEAGDDQIAYFLKEGAPDMMHPIDETKVPNLKNISAKPALGEGYYVPYRGTTVVMAYNSEKLPNPPKTTAELTQWIKDNPTRFSYNAAGTGGAGASFIRTSIYNFLPEEALMSSDEKWVAEWDQGFAYLAEIHPFLYKSGDKVVYPNKNQGTIDLLVSGELDLIPAWADQVISGIQNGSIPATTKIYQLDPPLNGALNTFCVPTFGTNSEEAFAVIDFMLSDEVQQILLEDLAAIPLIDSADLDSSNAELIKSLDVSDFRTQSVGDLSKIMDKRWDEEIATLS